MIKLNSKYTILENSPENVHPPQPSFILLVVRNIFLVDKLVLIQSLSYKDEFLLKEKTFGKFLPQVDSMMGSIETQDR